MAFWPGRGKFKHNFFKNSNASFDLTSTLAIVQECQLMKDRTSKIPVYGYFLCVLSSITHIWVLFMHILLSDASVILLKSAYYCVHVLATQ